MSSFYPEIRSRFVKGIVLAALVAAPLANCGGQMPGGGLIPGLGNCPDGMNVSAIEAFDFAGEFKLDPELAGRVKASMSTAATVNRLSAEVDGELKGACAAMATDLGSGGDFKSAEEACNAAANAMSAARAKLGAHAKISVAVSEPRCSVEAKAMVDCAAKCDASVKPGSVDVKCEGGHLQGECSGKCEGSCDVEAGATCSGECSGSCDAEIHGTCSGACNGKCDGKASSASCGGVCEGKCEGQVHASCKGKCGGHCEVKGSAECKGTCTGKCSVEMKAPRCTGSVTPPHMSAECKAKCNTEVEAKATCTPPHVIVAITGGVDAQLAGKYRLAIEKHLPVILKMAVGVGKRVGALAGEVDASIRGVEGAFKAKLDAANAAKLAACVAKPFSDAASSVGRIQGSVKVSLHVQASATASTSGGGGAASASGSASGAASANAGKK